MKKTISIFIIATTFASCTALQTVVSNLPTEQVALSEADVANGLKEALNQGISNGVSELIKTDGYFANQAIKLFLPPEAQKVQDLIVKNIPQGQKLIDQAVLKMNRAAEDAANEAKPIFVEAITSMTILDAKNILFGKENAATDYLKQKTYQKLVQAYSPKINASLSKVGATQAWQALTTPYNKLANSPAGMLVNVTQPINSDLAAYTTQKALDGLFWRIAQEEQKIRKNPVARTTALLQRVFGELDKK
ncbi:MAG: DUF4197 domain-containing protein [Thermonemataceae bacterium]|nr:DUF4197 domain-containing protein [Thermonemataceae bacterium]